MGGRRGGAALRAYLQQQARALTEASAAARRGDPEGVHDVRVAARRARSALAAHRRVLPTQHRGEARALERDLRSHAAGLSARRDAEAGRELVTGWADQHAWPAERTRLVLAALEQRSAAAERSAVAPGGAARDPEALLAGSVAAGLTARVDAVAAAAAAGSGGLQRGVHRSWRRVSRRWVVVQDRATAGARRDEALHDVRKAAKRLRYAAEVAAAADDAAAPVAAAAKAVQRLLGDRQDAIVLTGLLGDRDEDPATEAALSHARRLAGETTAHADTAVPAAVRDLRDAVRDPAPT